MMQSQLNQLATLLNEVADLQAAGSLLSWDQQTYMPPAGAEGRGHQMATIRSLAHKKFTSPDIGRLLDELAPLVAELDPDSDEARLVKVTRRLFEKRTKVPAELVAEMTRAAAVGTQAWRAAREDDNFASFEPYLENLVALRRQYAELFAPYDHIYDPLLDDFEPGMKTSQVQAIFNALRPQQVALIQQITGKPEIDDSFLHQPYDEQKQWDFGVEVISRFGYDWQRGRQDKSPHPFTQGISVDDIRITTRVYPDYLNAMLFGTMHEAGHALYGLGIDRKHARTPLAGGASLAVHESQSRLWENLVGRSLAFWEHFYPHLQQAFPTQLAGISLERFYQGINKVKPSFIRVEADEATYNLHIMLRLELEIALMEGTVPVKALPDAWSARMQEYLGVLPPNNALGVLQDIHWSQGSIGYFSTYALGNLISAQLWEVVQRDIPDLQEQLRRGEFSALLGWLRQSIHRHGAKFEPQELVEKVTGSPIDPAPYMRYLQHKFGQIYGL